MKRRAFSRGHWNRDKRKVGSIFVALLFLALTQYPSAAENLSAESVSGLFQTEPGDSGGYLHVRVGPCSENPEQVCGMIESAFSENGDVSTDYEHLGKKMLWKMVDKGNGKYASGKIWAPDRDKTYRSKMQISDTGLKVKGCVGPICRAQNWKRVE